MPARRHHPTLAPSAFPALAKCAQYQGSLTVGAAAIRGTRIGATVEEILTGQKQEEAFDLNEINPDVAIEIAWTRTALEAIYGDFVELEVEEEVAILDDEFREVTFGTADYYRYGHLADLKTGEKRSYREQMAALSLGFMDRDGLETMTVSLLWSRFQEVETWTWSRAEVEAIVWPIIHAVRASLPPVPNPYCSWCRKKETCSARTRAVSNLPLNIPTSGDLKAHMDAISPAERAHLIRQIQIAKKWCEDAETSIEDWFLSDPEAHAIEGYTLGKTSPKRAWANEATAAIALQTKALEMGKDPNQLMVTKVVPVTRVREILGNSKPVRELVDSLLVKPEGKPALVVDWSRGGKKNPILPGQGQETTEIEST